MAYAQPRYGVAQGPDYGHPETPYERQQQRDHAAYDHRNGYQKHDNYHEQMYETTPYQSDRYYAPHDKMAGHVGGHAYHGGTTKNRDTGQREGYGGQAVQQPQSRAGYDERHAYGEPRTHPPSQPNHHSPAHGPRPPPVNRHQQKGASGGGQRSQAQQNGYYQEPVLQSELTHAEEGYHRNDRYYQPREDRGYRTQRPPIAISKNAEAVNQRLPPAGQNPPQVHMESHGNGVVQGGSGSHGTGSAPKPASSHGQRQPTPPKLATAQLPKC